MTALDPDRSLEECSRDIALLEKVLKRSTSDRVRSSEERDLSKATSLTYFNRHRPVLQGRIPDEKVSALDEAFQTLFRMSDASHRRASYKQTLKEARETVRESRVALLSATGQTRATPDVAPAFSPLIQDPEMQRVLARRWEECVRCIAGGADLAAIVMMGGLLEALLLSRLLRENDKSVILKAASTPKDRKPGKVLPLHDWTLNNYIDVAHEMQWVSQTVKDVGSILRDYRNYVHPQKELANKLMLKPGDSSVLWEVTKSISRQLLK